MNKDLILDLLGWLDCQPVTKESQELYDRLNEALYKIIEGEKLG